MKRRTLFGTVAVRSCEDTLVPRWDEESSVMDSAGKGKLCLWYECKGDHNRFVMMDLTGKNVNGWIIENKVNTNDLFTFYIGIIPKMRILVSAP